MVKCSYCRQDGHNRSNCIELTQDIRSELAAFTNASVDNSQIIVPMPQVLRATLIHRRLEQHKQQDRERRRRDRRHFENTRLERMRVRIAIETRVRERIRGLVSTSVDQYISNLSPDEAANISNEFHIFTRRHYPGNYTQQFLSGLQRATANNSAKKVENPIETTECPICFDEFSKTDRTITSCGHQFHSTCLFKHLQRANTCPCCRGVLF
tara:strand:- start:127 stop:759 length:633 start_codon:yes stop_codon:yes gene_type:complete